VEAGAAGDDVLLAVAHPDAIVALAVAANAPLATTATTRCPRIRLLHLGTGPTSWPYG
jgi:hypothetical protein